jgi:hypothetical protein
LLAFGFVLTGCDHRRIPTQAELDAQKVGRELGDGVAVDGSTITVTAKDKTLTTEITILEDVTLFVPAGTQTDPVKFTVDSGGTLNVAGNVEVEGTFEVKGELNIDKNSTVTVATGGTYIIEGEGTNEGEIVIEAGGETWGNGGDIKGSGFTVVEAGGKAYLGGTNEATRIYAIGNGTVQTTDALLTYPLLQMTSQTGSLSFNNNYYELTGDANINGVPNSGENGTNSFFVGYCANGDDSNNRILTLKAGSTLTITGNDVATKKVLGVVVYGDNPGIIGEDGAQIILGTNGYIDIYEQTGDPMTGDTPGIGDYPGNISNINHNFYSGVGSKETSNGLTNKTYTWSTNADKNGNSGWVADNS